jgi:hypothetical protein
MDLFDHPETIQQLVDLYFTYLYPRFAFPHEIAFRAALLNPADGVNTDHLSLIGAICAVTVQSFPRGARIIFEFEPAVSASGEAVVPPSMQDRVDTFVKTSLRARQDFHGLRDDLSVNDAVVSFLLAVTHSTGGRWQQYRFFMGECLSTLKMIQIRQNEGNFKDFADFEVAGRVQGAAFAHIQ